MIKLSHCYYHNSTQEQLNLTAQSQEHNLVDGERDTRKTHKTKQLQIIKQKLFVEKIK